MDGRTSRWSQQPPATLPAVAPGDSLLPGFGGAHGQAAVAQLFVSRHLCAADETEASTKNQVFQGALSEVRQPRYEARLACRSESRTRSCVGCDSRSDIARHGDFGQDEMLFLQDQVFGMILRLAYGDVDA